MGHPATFIEVDAPSASKLTGHRRRNLPPFQDAGRLAETRAVWSRIRAYLASSGQASSSDGSRNVYPFDYDRLPLKIKLIDDRCTPVAAEAILALSKRVSWPVSKRTATTGFERCIATSAPPWSTGGGFAGSYVNHQPPADARSPTATLAAAPLSNFSSASATVQLRNERRSPEVRWSACTSRSRMARAASVPYRSGIFRGASSKQSHHPPAECARPAATS